MEPNPTLQQWAANGWLRPHRPSAQEIAGLLAIVDRDLVDAEGTISPDWRFGIAYNAALKLCAVLLHASGYRPEKTLQHYRTLMALPVVLGPARRDDAEYLDACRTKRNTVEYEQVGGATDDDADELIAFARNLRGAVVDWLAKHHPTLLSKGRP